MLSPCSEGFLREVLEGRSAINLTKNNVFGDGTNAPSWADKMTDRTLMDIYSRVCAVRGSGGQTLTRVCGPQFCGKPMVIRDGEVRAGGDEPGKTFQCTPGQATVRARHPNALGFGWAAGRLTLLFLARCCSACRPCRKTPTWRPSSPTARTPTA